MDPFYLAQFSSIHIIKLHRFEVILIQVSVCNLGQIRSWSEPGSMTSELFEINKSLRSLNISFLMCKMQNTDKNAPVGSLLSVCTHLNRDSANVPSLPTFLCS